MIDNIISTVGFGPFVVVSIITTGFLVLWLAYIHQKPKTDKQLAVLDAYIDSVARANDLVTVSLPINNKKLYKKLLEKIQKDFQEIHRRIKGVINVDKISYGNFVFANCNWYSHPTFQGKEIYDFDKWLLSPNETLCLMKEWPEAKLEILKIHRQNILDFNHIVNELVNLV